MRVRTALLLLLLGFAVGAFVFLALQGGIPGLPTSPFAKAPDRIPLTEEASGAERRLIARFPQLRPRRVSARSDRRSVRLTERDVRDLALAGLMRRPGGQRVLALAHALSVEITGGELGVELQVDLEELPRELLTDSERRRLEQVEDLLPLLGGVLPIAVYGRPEAHRGRLRLGGRPRVELSILKLSLETVGKRLGKPTRELNESLEIDVPGYEVIEVVVGEGVVELVVRPA